MPFTLSPSLFFLIKGNIIKKTFNDNIKPLFLYFFLLKNRSCCCQKKILLARFASTNIKVPVFFNFIFQIAYGAIKLSCLFSFNLSFKSYDYSFPCIFV